MARGRVGRRRRGVRRLRGAVLDEHGDLHAAPAVAAAADEVVAARVVELEHEAAAAVVADEGVARVALVVRRLVRHLHHVVHALGVVELCSSIRAYVHDRISWPGREMVDRSIEKTVESMEEERGAYGASRRRGSGTGRARWCS